MNSIYGKLLIAVLVVGSALLGVLQDYQNNSLSVISWLFLAVAIGLVALAWKITGASPEQRPKYVNYLFWVFLAVLVVRAVAKW